MGLDQKELDKILEWFNKSNLTSAKIEHNAEGSYKITMSREASPMQTTSVIAAPAMQAVAQGSGTPEASEEKVAESNTEQVTSPIVGTFYSAPGPDTPAFVQVGDTVKKGETLCIIEAMKVMNELEAEFDLEIVSLLVDNNDLVEFGQAIFEVKPL